MTTHYLKTVQPYFDSIWSGEKLFELRKNDRGFAVHDDLILREYDPRTDTYTGRAALRYVIYISDYPDAIREGYVCLGLMPPEQMVKRANWSHFVPADTEDRKDAHGR